MTEKNINNLLKFFRNKNGSGTLLIEGEAMINQISDSLYSINSGEFYYDGKDIVNKGEWYHTQFRGSSDKIEIDGEYRSFYELFKSEGEIRKTN